MSTMPKTDGELLAGSGMMFSRSAFRPVTPLQGNRRHARRNPYLIDDLAVFLLEVAIEGLIIIIVMPHSRMVAEMKPHAWAEVHGYARAMMASPIANVVLVNVTTVV
jgi:hypothetical protein